MRVIAGKARHLPLKTPPGSGTRPTTDRIKETLFNILQNDVPGATFLDLYAGSGAIGIEALSRGAVSAVFADRDKKAVSCIRDNLAFTKLSGGTVLAMDALQALRTLEGREAFDLVFMDPPYGQGLEKEALAYLRNSSLVSGETLLILESDLETDLSWIEDSGFQVVREKTYKTNRHLFIRKKERE